MALKLIETGDPLRRLRLAAAAALMVGALSLFALQPTGIYLAAMALFLGGSYFSHRMKGASSRLVKSLLAVAMLYLLWRYFQNLLANLADTRLPLAELLLWLQALNSWDLPRRHNLRIAMMVGGILVVATATLSRDTAFGLWLLAFMAAGLWWGYEDMASEVEHAAAMPPAMRRALVRLGLGVGLAALGLFLFVPRWDAGFVRAFPVSVHLELPKRLDARISNPGYPSGGLEGRSRARRFNPEAYYGFAESLDLNYRGHLSSAIALKVRAPRPQYWRGMAYDRYDGHTWTMHEPTRVATQTVPQLPFNLPGDPQGHDKGRTGVVTVYVERDQSNLVFLPERGRYLYFPSSLLFTDVNDSVRSPVPLDANLYYTVVQDLAGYERRWLQGSRPFTRVVTERLRPYRELPPSVTARTRELAHQWALGGTDPFDRLKLVEAHLKLDYRYELDIPPYPERADTVDHFLFVTRTGYCEHFATTMAVMGRILGYPTRLVTGYLPGEFNPFSGLYEVRTSDAHSWVEVYFPNAGWVPFDPTPGGGAPMELADEQVPVKSLLGAAQGALGVGLLLAVMAAVASLLSLLFRERPRRPAPTDAYRRFLYALQRQGHEPGPAGRTPREHLERVAADPRLGAIAPEAERFVTAYEAERYGAIPAAPPLAHQVQELERSLAALPREPQP